ncbi:sterol homeostasis protein [Kappamyces sp. JEL0829]|nr:sterol homeostasis protein [Kappamyces sp. JEL0829]KAJ3336000.1 sterol homeostasis protein [Kappamyces sp. JEL0680]
MQCCIECGTKVEQLYRVYGPASSGSIRLTQCEVCHEFVDKYLEFDLVVIFIDLVLLKKAAYRHMIFNRIPYDTLGLNDSIVRLAILLNLFEVYMKWFQMEKIQHPLAAASKDLPVHWQYLLVLSICLMEFFLFHLTIRNVSQIVLGTRLCLADANHLSTTLVLSSFGKILLIVMVIWDYGSLNPSFFINFFVLVCNWVAITVTLQLGFWKVGHILFYGLAVKMAARLLTGLYDPLTVVIL